MSKKLAIKGHRTHGKEVIKLLEMMGGKNIYDYDCDCMKNSYYVCNHAILCDSLSIEDDDFVILTLEEFLEKYPFKVGDVIKFPNDMAEEIAEMKWDEELDDIIYTSVSGWTRPCSVPKNTNNKTNMETYCKKCGLHYGSVQCFDKDCPHNISKSYALGLKDGKVIECGVNKEIVMNENKVESAGFMQMGKTISVIFNDANYEDEVELQLGDYEIEVRDGKTYAVKKKPKYPKTYDECCEIIHSDPKFYIDTHLYSNTLEILYRLLICRDAYWKIAGEEMGLGKPWEPNWNHINRKFYCIYNSKNNIVKNVIYSENKILAFPTEEMHDAFYDNFKDLIEQCKELL